MGLRATFLWCLGLLAASQTSAAAHNYDCAPIGYCTARLECFENADDRILSVRTSDTGVTTMYWEPLFPYAVDVTEKNSMTVFTSNDYPSSQQMLVIADDLQAVFVATVRSALRFQSSQTVMLCGAVK